MSKFIQRIAVTLALAASSLTAHAAPFTFEFTMPVWSGNNNPAVLGTNALLEITVDNGSSSSASQTYLNSQITSFAVTALGGTFNHTWNSGFYGSSAESFVSTDSAGIATLDLLSANGAGAYYNSSSAGLFIQLARFNPSQGSWTPFAIWGDGLHAYFFQPEGFAVVGSSDNDVPEPLSVALLGLGLAGVAFSRRKQSR